MDDLRAPRRKDQRPRRATACVPCAWSAAPSTAPASTSRRGGAGSWLEVMGGDRRVVMDRLHQASPCARPRQRHRPHHRSRATACAPTSPDTEHSSGRSEPHPKPVRPPTSTWVQRLARRNGFQFWLSYEVDLGLVVTTKEIGNFKPSPPRPELSSARAAACSTSSPAASPPRLRSTSPARRHRDHGSASTSRSTPSGPTHHRAPACASLENRHPAPTTTSHPRTPARARSAPSPSRTSPLRRPARACSSPPPATPPSSRTRAKAALSEAEWFVEAPPAAPR
jgi:hypothetical protein